MFGSSPKQISFLTGSEGFLEVGNPGSCTYIKAKWKAKEVKKPKAFQIWRLLGPQSIVNSQQLLLT